MSLILKKKFQMRNDNIINNNNNSDDYSNKDIYQKIILIKII